MEPISVGITVFLKVMTWIIGFTGNSKKLRQWVQKQADALHEKGWLTAAFIVDLEDERVESINEKLDEMDKAEQTGDANETQ